MFNIVYLAGLAGILLAWNSAIIIKVTVSDQHIPYTAACLTNSLESKRMRLESKPFYPLAIVLVVLSLCVIFLIIITKRKNIYLSQLQDSHLRNLPAKNALTYIDTLILFSIIYGSKILKLFCVLLRKFDFMSFENMTIVTSIMSIIVEDIGVGFIFPIYIILKTKRYLPKLWDDSRQIIAENNDFFSTNPAAVAPAPQPQPTNQQIAESSFWVSPSCFIRTSISSCF